VSYARRSRALSGPLTELTCNGEQFARDWAERLDTGLNVGAQAAVVGALGAGAIGALIKRPLLGGAIGAALGAITYTILTGPQRP